MATPRKFSVTRVGGENLLECSSTNWWQKEIDPTGLSVQNPHFKRCPSNTTTPEKSRVFLDTVAQSNVETHILEHQVTENVQGILSARVQR